MTHITINLSGTSSLFVQLKVKYKATQDFYVRRQFFAGLKPNTD